MKKFVIVMITILVLFVFLMVNYLLWDKENLLKQTESDKIEQDWLRGQNRTLQSTVNEQEQAIKALEKEKNQLSTRISGLEQELKRINSLTEDYRKEIAEKGQAINNYKMFTEGLLCELTLDWFESISNRDYEAAWDLLASDHMIFGKQYNREDFFRYLESVHSIGLVRKAGEEDDGAGKEGYKKHWTADGFSFEILKGYGDEYEVMTELQVEVVLDGKHAGEVTDWMQGLSQLRMLFLFSHEDQKWEIKTVTKANN